MADADDDKDLKLDDDKDELATKEAGPKPGAPHIVLRIVLGVSGLLLLVGFFLPWLKLADHDAVSGIDLVLGSGDFAQSLVGQGSQRYVLLLIPGFGVALTAVGFLGVRYSGQIAALLGVLIVGSGMVTVVIFFFQKTGIGLWLILLGAFIAVAAGTITFARSRSRREPEEPTD